jgi:outer membrane protein TolC
MVLLKNKIKRRAFLLLAAIPVAIIISPVAFSQTSAPVSFDEAVQQASLASVSVQGAHLNARSKELKADALSRINWPSLSLTGFKGRISTSVNVDVNQMAGTLNPMIPSLPLPDLSVDRNVSTDLTSFGLRSIWPIYTGGRLDAIKGVAHGASQEAYAEHQDEQEKMVIQVAERYFQLLLAKQVASVRAQAAAGIAQHQISAKKLEASGMISRAERLRADVALDNAKSEAAQAASDAEIAQVALDRLLAVQVPVKPTTPLFIHSKSVGSLQSFIDAGMRQNVAWKKIDSKRTQAAESLRLQGREFSPTVFAVGTYNANRSAEKHIQPNWFVGIAVSIPIVDRIDTGKMRQAAKLDQERVELTAQQAERDIPTLIEKNWRALENARIQFLASGSSIELAQENLKLQSIAFAQGQVPVLDEVDARLNLLKAQTQRVQIAYTYVMALAQLLEASGEADRLGALATTADIVFPLEGD